MRHCRNKAFILLLCYFWLLMIALMTLAALDFDHKMMELPYHYQKILERN